MLLVECSEIVDQSPIKVRTFASSGNLGCAEACLISMRAFEKPEASLCAILVAGRSLAL
jgi:hypothetical protein